MSSTESQEPCDLQVWVDAQPIDYYGPKNEYKTGFSYMLVDDEVYFAYKRRVFNTCNNCVGFYNNGFKDWEINGKIYKYPTSSASNNLNVNNHDIYVGVMQKHSALGKKTRVYKK